MTERRNYLNNWMIQASKLVGANIAKHRKKKGLTQEQLAQESGITSEYVSRLENQKENPTVNLLERIAKALSIEVIDLFRR